MSGIVTVCKSAGAERGPVEQAVVDAALISAAPDLLAACKAQHEAIDRLFASLIDRYEDHGRAYFPSRSGQPWEASHAGRAAIEKAQGDG